MLIKEEKKEKERKTLEGKIVTWLIMKEEKKKKKPTEKYLLGL